MIQAFMVRDCNNRFNIVLLSAKICFSTLFLPFQVGIVFAKLSRPKKRTQTLLFSRHAVISHRDGIPCFMFRVGDMRKSHIIEAHVRAQLIRHKVTKEGESLPFFQTELKVKSYSKLLLTWMNCLNLLFVFTYVQMRINLNDD